MAAESVSRGTCGGSFGGPGCTCDRSLGYAQYVDEVELDVNAGWFRVIGLLDGGEIEECWLSPAQVTDLLDECADAIACGEVTVEAM